MKLLPKSGKTEILQQVKLTANQRIALIHASNEGGRMSERPDFGVTETLRHLRLIEKRSKYSPEQIAVQKAKAETIWKSLPEIVKARNTKALERAANEIRSIAYDLMREGYWITKAGREYLTNGRVVVTAGTEVKK